MTQAPPPHPPFRSIPGLNEIKKQQTRTKLTKTKQATTVTKQKQESKEQQQQNKQSKQAFTVSATLSLCSFLV